MTKQELLKLVENFYDEEQYDELSFAIDFATEKHSGQKRKSGEPFVIHPIAVAGILVEWGMDNDSVIAGVLHDTIEDTDTTYEEIEKYFGRDVAFLVAGVTKVSQARSGMRDISSYLPETKDNLTKLLIAVGQDVRVLIIKLADRLHNMQTLKYKSPPKQMKIARETIDVFAPLADRLNMGRVKVQLEDLSFSYIDAKEYRRLGKLLKDRLGKSHRKLAKVRHNVDLKLNEEKIEHKIDGRVKSIYSLYKKLHKVDNIDNIYDLIALRVIVEDIATCYLVLGVIHGLYKPMVNRIKDYIARPKSNGYQSLHTTVITETGQIVEFQIRTVQMHEYAERGLAASFHYNEQKLTDAYRKGQIAAMPANLSWIRHLQTVAAQLSVGKEVDVDDLKIDLFGDRIFVYSPKGDIYDFPEGAHPLDFAYRIHSDIAKHSAGFIVNGKMVAFDYILQDGDVIEVLTSKNAKPNPDWATHIVTGHAKEKLRSHLRQNGIIQSISNAANNFQQHTKTRFNRKK